MADVNIYIIDDKEFDLTMWVDSALTWGDVGVQSIADMVKKVLKICEEEKSKIGRLTIVGHGNEYGQFVGRDWLGDFANVVAGGLDSSIPLYRADLVKLRGHFGKTGEVILGGCRVGRNSSLLLRLSDIWMVPVSAFTAYQRPVLPGDESGQTTCYITCTRQGRTFADSFDDVQDKIIEWKHENMRRLSNGWAARRAKFK